MRRYCAANRLNRLGTLTYEGEGCHDPDRIREDLARFFRALRSEIVEQTLPLRHGVRTGGEFPYLWVPQWHPGGHGLHAHFVVGRYIPRRAIERAWGHGFVHITMLSGLSTRSGPLEEARLAGRYASRYLLAQAEDERRRLGLHRYEVAQGFQPVEELLRGDSPDELIDEVSQRFGCKPSRQWHSEGSEGWHGPPACWAIWPG